MKTISLSLILLFLLLIGCKKEKLNEKPTDSIIVGGLYMDYTDIIHDTCDIKVNISGEMFSFNKLNAMYSSHQPSSNQNVFIVCLSDTVNNKSIDFEIFTEYIKPEDFFTKNTFNIDTIKIAWAGVRENFFDADVKLIWDTVSFEDRKFTGKATLKITKKIMGTINPETYYTKQQLNFEFK